MKIFAIHGSPDRTGNSQRLGGVDAPTQLPMSSGPNEGHFKLAEDFGKKLARGENLIGQKIW